MHMQGGMARLFILFGAVLEKGNADAFNTLGMEYVNGERGLPRDFAKANELFLKAGELGCATSYFNLALHYKNGNGVEADEGKVKHYYELAAMMGNLEARHNLSVLEVNVNRNIRRAFKHTMVTASAGDTQSLDKVKKAYLGEGFTQSFVTKDEYETTLRSYHERQLEMKSDARDKAAEAHSSLRGIAFTQTNLSL